MVRTRARRAVRTRNEAKGGPLKVEDWVAAANDLLVNENIRGVQIRLMPEAEGDEGKLLLALLRPRGFAPSPLNSWRRRMTLNVASKLGRVSDGRRQYVARAAGVAAKEVLRCRCRHRNEHSRLGPQGRARARCPKGGRRDAPQVLRAELPGARISKREARIRGYIAYAIMMGDSILKETLREEIRRRSLSNSQCSCSPPRRLRRMNDSERRPKGLCLGPRCFAGAKLCARCTPYPGGLACPDRVLAA